MDMQTMKIAFIEEFLKLKDESIIIKLTTTLKREKQKYKRTSIEKFAGILNDEEAKEFLEASRECRKIDIDEW
jgi:hypothetical protein